LDLKETISPVSHQEEEYLTTKASKPASDKALKYLTNYLTISSLHHHINGLLGPG